MQDFHHSNSVLSAQNFIWIGIGIGLLYWLLESLMHITVFGEGPFLEHVFTPDVHEIWKRLSVFVLIILFSIYAQRSINIRRRTERALADREQELSRILENNPAGIMLVDAASRRQKWIDQAQSLNLYINNASGKKLDITYRMAWYSGLKTTYYLRSLAATGTEKSTIDTGSLNAVSKAESAPTPAPVPQACSLDDPDCEACQ